MATAESSPSVTTRPPCTVCNRRLAIYTCPRCATRTCSLPCASTHKAGAGCSGERDRAAYVPMNCYGWGTMMDDYAFLEDVGRRVGDWGSEIARGRFQAAGGRGRGSTRGGGRGRGGGAGGGKTKRDVLRMQLEARDIEMDLLSAGMERHKLNQSPGISSANRTALLTIEFKFCPPPNPLAPSSQAPEPPYTLLTHRNSLDTPLHALIQRHIRERKDGACPAWVRALVCDDDVALQCVMASPAAPRATRGYYRFDTAQCLAALLRATHFVEFPTIEAAAVEERAPKRQRLNKAAGRAIAGLLDGPEWAGDAWGVLGQRGRREGAAAEEGEGEGEEEDTDDEVELDPAALLALMRKARGDENWTPHAGDDDLVDWGESDHET
ncbi:hypothetical protein B0H10DRAFT_2210459 [Mycena sp. CBHHK59/15]|nr:hypothetical protein B0H10DRAFT_2210459 [Mycena sp. CBHHK59/15]